MLPIIVLATLAGTAYADSGLKPGLWEMHVGKHVVDGQDSSAQMAGMNAKMNEQMAQMSPEQRAKISAMMGQKGMAMPTGGGVIQMCITPEMAKRDVPVPDKDGACQPLNTRRSGNRMTYEFNCVSRDGTKSTGTGESTIKGDTVSSRSDMTIVDHGQTHKVQSESEMRFVKADCGEVKPMVAPKRE
jgi:hypothetical protein